MSNAVRGALVAEVKDQLKLHQGSDHIRHSALDCRELSEFFSKNNRSPAQKMVETMTEGVQQGIRDALDKGLLTISQPNVSGSNIHHKMVDMYDKKHQLERQLDLLNHLIKSQRFKPLRSITGEVTEQEHHRVVGKILKEKKQTDHKRKQYVQQLFKRREQEEDRQIDERKESTIRCNQTKRARIASQRKKRDEEKQKTMKKSHSSAEKEYKEKKLLYRELQNKYIQEVVLPAIEEKNQRLKDIKEMKRSVKIEEIRRHEEQYMRRRNAASHSVSKSTEKSPHQPSFKSAKFSKIREEEDRARRAENESRKASVQAKVDRVELYRQYLSDNFKPQVSEDKRRQLQDNIQKHTTPVRTPSTDSKDIGNSYLTYSKHRAKKSNSSSPSKNPEDMTITTQSTPPLLPITLRPNYLRANPKPASRVDKLNSLLKSQSLSASQKMYELQMETEKLNTMISEKELLNKVKELRGKHDTSGLFLASIKARLTMLQLYNS